MKKILSFMLVLSFVTVGFFTFTPTNSVQANESVSVTAPDTINVNNIWIGGIVKDYVYYSTVAHGGYHYRGYIVFQYTGYGGAYYGGKLFRDPLPYPQYRSLPLIK